MCNDIVKQDLIAGGFTEITVASTGKKHEIKSIEKLNDGSIKFTITPSVKKIELPVIEDAEFEIIKPTKND